MVEGITSLVNQQMKKVSLAAALEVHDFTPASPCVGEDEDRGRACSKVQQLSAGHLPLLRLCSHSTHRGKMVGPYTREPCHLTVKAQRTSFRDPWQKDGGIITRAWEQVVPVTGLQQAPVSQRQLRQVAADCAHCSKAPLPGDGSLEPPRWILL